MHTLHLWSFGCYLQMTEAHLDLSLCSTPKWDFSLYLTCDSATVTAIPTPPPSHPPEATTGNGYQPDNDSYRKISLAIREDE
ncbi:hypothetical protein K7X08_005590 [Anisodus acutangulus]|uniref:Uncharacterized protein n=1 Tax=Anisodus acutangulus TaxID=402998 RepID=A0A9Q1LVP3_9SOLA|nr:hypothetical protein K7X08_005590 [Anisodus acutangulus]